jgi:hypothetical protein
MPTEKQIAANRANAKRSTGPKSLAGKLKSSRNAYRHGLSVPSPLGTIPSEKIMALTQALVREHASDTQLYAAAELATAHFELARVRAMRTELFGKIEGSRADIKDFKRLAALDRYERPAQRRRRRAARDL